MKRTLFILQILFGIYLNAQVTDNEIKKAEEFFKNSSVLTYNEDYDPSDYIGSLIYYKKDKPNEFKVIKLTNSDSKEIKRTEKGEIIYQKMHTKNDVTNAKFLGIFNSTVQNNNLLEVVLTKNYSLEAPNVFENLELSTKINNISNNLIKNGFVVEYIWKVNVNQLTSRLYKEGKIEAGLNYQIQGDTKIYNQSENFQRKGLLTLQTYDTAILLPSVADNVSKLLKSSNDKSTADKPLSDKSLNLSDFQKIYSLTTKNNKYVVSDKIEFVENK